MGMVCIVAVGRRTGFISAWKCDMYDIENWVHEKAELDIERQFKQAKKISTQMRMELFRHINADML